MSWLPIIPAVWLRLVLTVFPAPLPVLDYPLEIRRVRLLLLATFSQKKRSD